MSDLVQSRPANSILVTLRIYMCKFCKDHIKITIIPLKSNLITGTMKECSFLLSRCDVLSDVVADKVYLHSNLYLPELVPS